MASQIEEEASRLLRRATLSPVVSGNGPPALESRLESKYLPEGVVGEQSAHGEEVAIPSPVLKDGDDAVSAPSLGDESAGLGRVSREGLVDDDMKSSRQRLVCEQGVRAAKFPRKANRPTSPVKEADASKSRAGGRRRAAVDS